jgi:hypothetical protein
MLELFSRPPVGLELAKGQTITPVPIDEDVASLSAILMDDDYYQLIVATRRDVDGVPMVGAAGLIPLKARAWLDMQDRRAAGAHVDEDDLKKHRNDVFRLALTLAGQSEFVIANAIRQDLDRFLAAFPVEGEDWAAIRSALRTSTRTPPAPADLIDALKAYFRLL